MAVMSQKVNVDFEVAPDKREQFLKETKSAKSFTNIMLRAAKNIDEFKIRTVKRK